MSKLVVILGFAIAFAAGLVVGTRADLSRLGLTATSKMTSTTTAPTDGIPDVSTPTDDPRNPDDRSPRSTQGGDGKGRGGRDRGPGGWLAAELGLSSEQHAQLDTIWSGLAERGRNRDHEGQRREMRAERDEAVASLIPQGRWEEYQAIIADFTERNAALDREFRADFDHAVERTKQILTPAQRTKYDALLARHRWGPPDGEDRRGGDRHRDRRPETGATSQPDREGDPSPPTTTPSHGAQKGAQE